jgi:hypothetical protein
MEPLKKIVQKRKKVTPGTRNSVYIEILMIITEDNKRYEEILEFSYDATANTNNAVEKTKFG